MPVVIAVDGSICLITGYLIRQDNLSCCKHHIPCCRGRWHQSLRWCNSGRIYRSFLCHYLFCAFCTLTDRHIKKRGIHLCRIFYVIVRFIRTFRIRLHHSRYLPQALFPFLSLYPFLLRNPSHPGVLSPSAPFPAVLSHIPYQTLPAM